MPCSNQNLGHGLAYAMHSQFRLSFNSLTNWSLGRILKEKNTFCDMFLSKDYFKNICFSSECCPSSNNPVCLIS